MDLSAEPDKINELSQDPTASKNKNHKKFITLSKS